MTIILNKQNFLKWIETQISDSQVLVIATDLTKAEVKKRTNEKRIEYSFAADTFVHIDSVGDFYNSMMPSIAVAIAPKHFVNEKTLKLIKA